MRSEGHLVISHRNIASHRQFRLAITSHRQRGASAMRAPLHCHRIAMPSLRNFSRHIYGIAIASMYFSRNNFTGRASASQQVLQRHRNAHRVIFYLIFAICYFYPY
jgi:hypothetical protein